VGCGFLGPSDGKRATPALVPEPPFGIARYRAKAAPGAILAAALRLPARRDRVERRSYFNVVESSLKNGGLANVPVTTRW
jgi:hypothetical protein